MPSARVAELIKNRMVNCRPEFKNDKAIKSGTTTFAFYYRDGVIFGADSRTTSGNLIYRHDSKKISTISKFSLFSGTGTVAHIQYVKDILIEFIREFRVESDNMHLSLGGQARLLKETLRVISNYALLDANFILGGYDLRTKEFLIFEFDDLGGWYPVTPKQKYASTGSGGEIAASILNSKLDESKKVTEDAARDIALIALRESAHQDACSEPPTINKPTIIRINKNGVRDIS